MTTSWISDSLITLVGMTDDTTVQYLIALARQTTSVQQLSQKIADVLPTESVAAKELISKLYDQFG